MNKVQLWNELEYNYAAACGFIPNVRLYFHKDEKIRPCMLIVPDDSIKNAANAGSDACNPLY